MTTPIDDIRRRGFGPVAAVADVLAHLSARVSALPPEVVPLAAAAGRVLAAPVASAVDVPPFRRVMMDGYAVRAADGPGERAVVGRALPGRPFAGTLRPGDAVRVATGAPLPDGADAVVMVERAEPRGDGVVVRDAISSGKHVGRVGEDVSAGAVVLPAGRRLRPQDVGLLAAIGAAAVGVVRRPRVAVLVTGDELLPPGASPVGVRVVDSNSPMLLALAARDGGVCRPPVAVADRFEAVRDAIASAAADADVVLVSGGTSVGSEDHAPRALAAVGELIVHGVAVRPAKPVGIGFVARGGEEERRRGGDEDGLIGIAPPLLLSSSPCPVFLLPGNPVACLCGCDLFAGPVVRRLGGLPWELPYRRARGTLTAHVPSAAGRVDYVRVGLADGRVTPVASGGASVLSSTVAADGFVLVPAERGELAAGEAVDVWLYD